MKHAAVIAGFVACTLAGPAYALVITGTGIAFDEVNDFSSANFRATVGQSLSARPSPVPIVLDATSVWFRYERSDTSTLVAIATNLDEGSSWWLAQAGQVFTDETIEAGMFTPLIMIGPSFHPAA